MTTREASHTDWAIHDVVRNTGITSRTLRHYDAIGLLPPSWVGPGGVRHYDEAALTRLQRILLLRDLGLSLTAIAQVLATAGSAESHLRKHLELLHLERERIDRQIRAVRRTITAHEKGTTMTKDMFDGFDHAQHEEEVTQRWGREAWETSDAWWSAKTPQERRDWKAEVAELSAAWVAAAQGGEVPDGDAAQALAARHVAWLASVPGTPAASGDAAALAPYVEGLAHMYVADERFRVNYTGVDGEVPGGPEFVRDALLAYSRLNLA